MSPISNLPRTCTRNGYRATFANPRSCHTSGMDPSLGNPTAVTSPKITQWSPISVRLTVAHAKYANADASTGPASGDLASCHFVEPKRSAPWVANSMASSSESSGIMFTVNPGASSIASIVPTTLSMQTNTMGGSTETDVNADTVRPIGPSELFAVTTVTVVATCAITSLKSLADTDIGVSLSALGPSSYGPLSRHLTHSFIVKHPRRIMTRHVQIVEVGPRDGLQNESLILTTDQKVDMITRLGDAGLSRIEAVSFAHPDLVPQMADAEAVMELLPTRDDVSYIGLILNWRGWRRAQETGVDEINMNVSASNTFNQENQGAGTDDTIDVLGQIVRDASTAGLPVTATIATAWGCPFEGEMLIDRLLFVAEAVAGTGVQEIVLADTIGVADPWTVTDRIGAVKEVVGGIALRAHFHNTRNTGIANAYAAIQAGVTTLDASVGGLGGCPFAPAATGNIPTDDLIYMLDRAGITTGVSLQEVIDVSRHMAGLVGRSLEAMLPKAGPFPDISGTG